MYKEILKDAGRFEEVCNILKKITELKDFDLPVNPFINICGEWQNRIRVDELKNQASILLEKLQQDDSDIEMLFNYDLSYLCNYVETISDNKLHNYANDISHRKEPYEDIEQIRPWLILSNMIKCLPINSDEFPWDIPNGWKKVDEINVVSKERFYIYNKTRRTAYYGPYEPTTDYTKAKK